MMANTTSSPKGVSLEQITSLTPPKEKVGVNFDDITPVKLPTTEEYKPLQSFASGFGKNATLLPGMFGYVGAGLETAADVVTGDAPITTENIGKAWDTAVSEGVDKDLIDYSEHKTKDLTNALGVRPLPIGTGNQIAELIGMLTLPVPSKFLRGSNIGLDLLGKTATFLTPAIRMGEKGDRLGKAFKIRAGTQYAVGGGIDQGIRAYVDNDQLPLMFSDQALEGRLPSTGVTLDQIQSVGVTDDQIEETGMPENIPAAEYLDPKLAALDKAYDEAELVETWKDYALIGGGILSFALLMKYRNALKASRQPDPAFGHEPGTPEMGDLASIYNQVKAQPTIGGKLSTAKELGINKLNKTFGNQVNSEERLAEVARAVGVAEHRVAAEIEQLKGQGSTDASVQVETMIYHGQGPDGEQIATPLRDLIRDFNDWAPERQTAFLDYMAGIQENIMRTRGTAEEFLEKLDLNDLSEFSKSEKGAIYQIRDALQGFTKRSTFDPNAGPFGDFVDEITKLSHGDLAARMRQYGDFVTAVRGTEKRVEVGLYTRNLEGKAVHTTDAELIQAIKAGSSDAEFQRIRKELVKYNKFALDDSVRRGVEDSAWADMVKRRYSFGGELVYIPTKEAVHAHNLVMRKAIEMGLSTTYGKTIKQVGNLMKRATKRSEGVAAPMNPFHTTHNYYAEMLEHTNRNVAQMNWLTRIIDMTFDADRAVFNKTPELQEAMAALVKNKYFTKLPQYIGRISPKDKENQFNRLNLEFLDEATETSNKRIADYKTRLLDDDPGVVQDAMHQIGLLNESLVVKRNGVFHIFGGMDPHFKHALEFDFTLMNGPAKFFNFFNRMMTAGTTGRYSTFSPVSFVYNASIGSLNAALINKGGMMEAGAEAIKVWRDGVKGATQIMTEAIADDFVQLISHSLKTGTGIGAKHPQLLKSVQDVLKRRLQNTFIRDFKGKAGRIGAGSPNASAFHGNITDQLDTSVFHISKKYGRNVLPQIVRIWDHVNMGFHEGTSYGVALRKLGGTTTGKSANQLRVAKRQAADLVGNNALQGASGFARQMTAAVPFYGATLQGLSTLGRAMKAAKFRNISKLTAFVGMPVAAEMAWNSFQGSDEKYKDAEGREWTHNEYYYKGFTPAQRASNIIMMKPGEAPWNAAVWSVIPEIAAIRGIYLDAFEVIFGLSDEARFSPDHMSEGFRRLINMPINPLVKAGLSAAGVDVRAEMSVVGADGTGGITARQLPKGNRVTPNVERARYQGGELSTRAAAIIQDLGGTLGTTAVKVYEAFFSGTDETPISERATAAVDQLGISLLSSARYASPLFPNTRILQTGMDQHVIRQVFDKKTAIKHWTKVGQQNNTGADMIGGFPAQGASQNMTGDPVTQIAAAEAISVSKTVQPLEKEISNYNLRINSLAHSLVNKFDFPDSPIPQGPITIAQRNELISTYRGQINEYQRIILQAYRSSEERINVELEEKLGREHGGFTYDSWKDRATPSSNEQAPPLSPPPSQ